MTVEETRKEIDSFDDNTNNFIERIYEMCCLKCKKRKLSYKLNSAECCTIIGDDKFLSECLTLKSSEQSVCDLYTEDRVVLTFEIMRRHLTKLLTSMNERLQKLEEKAEVRNDC
jgi:hypothetical protein